MSGGNLCPRADIEDSVNSQVSFRMLLKVPRERDTATTCVTSTTHSSFLTWDSAITVRGIQRYGQFLKSSRSSRPKASANQVRPATIVGAEGLSPPILLQPWARPSVGRRCWG